MEGMMNRPGKILLALDKGSGFAHAYYGSPDSVEEDENWLEESELFNEATDLTLALVGRLTEAERLLKTSLEAMESVINVLPSVSSDNDKIAHFLGLACGDIRNFLEE